MTIEALQFFLLAFIPLFVAVDPIGLTSLFLGLTREVKKETRKKIARQATLTAAVVAIGFVFLGQFIFRALGITVADFQVAGGLILLVLASRDLVTEGERKFELPEEFGIVPLGLPMVAGPAVLTTLLVLMQSLSVWLSLTALLINLALVYVGFRQCDRLERITGKTGLKAFSKIISLLLVAIAVNMIRRGLQGI